MKISPPISRFGGKGGMVNKILPFVPEHEVYVEPYCGTAALYFAKTPAQLNVLNDIDHTLIKFFKMLREPTQLSRFQQLINCTPYSRAEYEEYKYTWREATGLERLRRWYILNTQCMSGMFGVGWSHDVKVDHWRTISPQVGTWLNKIEKLPDVVQYLRLAQIEEIDAIKCILKYDSAKTFFYLDPPYLLSTRVTKSEYYFEYTDDDHKSLLETITKLKGKFLLSGYNNILYDDYLNSYNKYEFKTSAHAPRKEKQARRTEVLWYNYKVEGLPILNNGKEDNNAKTG